MKYTIKDYWGINEITILLANNEKPDRIAIGRVLSSNSAVWIHLKLSDLMSILQTENFTKKIEKKKRTK